MPAAKEGPEKKTYRTNFSFRNYMTFDTFPKILSHIASCTSYFPIMHTRSQFDRRDTLLENPDNQKVTSIFGGKCCDPGTVCFDTWLLWLHKGAEARGHWQWCELSISAVLCATQVYSSKLNHRNANDGKEKIFRDSPILWAIDKQQAANRIQLNVIN